jgi:hypothetical protein
LYSFAWREDCYEDTKRYCGAICWVQCTLGFARTHKRSIKGKVEVKFTLEQATKAHRGNRGTVLSLNSALDGGGWSTLRLGRFTPGKDPVLIVYEAGWSSEAVWRGAENLASTGIRSLERPARSESLYWLEIHIKLILRIHTCITVHLVRHLYYRVFVVCDVLTVVAMTGSALRDVMPQIMLVLFANWRLYSVK